MKTEKTIKPNSADQEKSAAAEAIKDISQSTKTELLRKKRVDPEVQ